MNHYVAFQPPHLNGRWQFCALNSRGGGPVCGCVYTDGHETREDAERHYYETTIATMRQPHTWLAEDEQRRCTGPGRSNGTTCGEWTQRRVHVHVGEFHDDVHVLCDGHARGISDPGSTAWRVHVRQFVPFRPGLEVWSS